MTDKINDGGPAFPQGHLDGPQVDPSGMSLRDWFAGMALPAVIERKTCAYPDQVAAISYRIADAMIAERERKV